MHSSKLKQMAIALSIVLLPYTAAAAGLGKLNVLSGLGEPLRADIELLSVTPEELSTITAVIAPSQAYLDQGIEKPASHNDIKIEVAKNSRGVPVLKLNSSQPITDAFLDMLIQVDWSSGRLLREYTLLLDPPGYSGETAQASTTQLPSISDADKVPSISSTASADPLPSMSGESSMSSGVKPVKKSKRSKPTTEEAPLPEIAPANEGGQEYTTARGDTLVKIAREMKPEGVSLEQMLVGLYQANPKAFDGKNMNRLKVGQIIRAPSQEALEATSNKKAKQQVRVHSANWNAYKNKLAGIVAESKDAETTSPDQSSSGKVTTAEDKATPQTVGPKDVVKLSAGDVNAKAASNSEKALQDKVTSLQEEAIAKENAVKEAQSRTADLEKQIEDMKKLMALKNDAMAKIQNDAAQAKAEPVKEVPTVDVTDKPEDTNIKAVEPVTPPMEVAKVEPPVNSVEPTKSVEPPKPAITTPTPMPEIEEPSFLAGLMENLDIGLLSKAGGALALIGGGWWFLRNKRKKSLASFEEGIMTSGGIKANTVFGNTAGGTVDTGDTSFLTDFSQSANGGMIDSHDVDPIAEAEVYMAYGRDAQAEEILKDAIIKEPKRHELHLKLLEIYQTSGNTSAFEAISGELYTTLGAEDPVWAKVAQLGVKMDPQNPLYKVASVGALTAGATVLGAADSGESKSASMSKEEFFASLGVSDEPSSLDIPSEISNSGPNSVSELEYSAPDIMETAKKTEVVESKSAGSELDIGSLNFDMDMGFANSNNGEVLNTTELDVLSSELVNIEASPAEQKPALELPVVPDLPVEPDLPYLPDENLGQPVSTVVEKAGVSSLSVPTIDFPSFEADPPSTVSEFSVDEEKALTPNPDELRLDVTSEDMSDSQAFESKFAQSSKDFDFSAINLDMGETSFGDEPKASDAGNEMTVSYGSGEPEEVETKLDLVMAYLDMEDSVGAKELLEEVMNEGGENQRKRAAELLAKIA